MNYRLIKRHHILIISAVVAFLLLIPLIGMWITDEIVWTYSDFVIMGSLLFVLGLLIAYILGRTNNRSKGIMLVVTVILIFLLIWAELSVGVLGTPWAGN